MPTDLVRGLKAHGVVCVKFSNLIMVPGDAGGEPPVSVAAVAARWVDRLQLLEVEFGNGLQLLRQPRCFEAGRQIVEPSAVLVLEVDQYGYRCRPTWRPRRGPPAWRRRRGLTTQPSTPPRLAFGWGHRERAEARSSHGSYAGRQS
jgi:hypothetical protein